MKLVWLIVRKDGRRFWVPLALWAVLITARQVMDWRVLHAVTEDGSWRQRMYLFSELFFALQILGGYLLAAALVLEDPPTGTAAFWMTRPLSGARLLGAKLLGVAILLLALPVLVSLPWWGMSGFPAQEIFSRAYALLCWQTVSVLAAMMVATFTRSLGQFLAWSLLLPAISLGLASAQPGIRDALFPTAHSTTTTAKLLGLLVAVGWVGALWVQYHTRRRCAAFAIVGASALVAIAAVVYVL